MSNEGASPSSTPSMSASRRRLQSEEDSPGFVSLSSAEGVSLLLSREREQFDDRAAFFASHGGESLGPLEQRSNSDKAICTAQGVVFQDDKFQQYKGRVEDLIQLAADPATSQSNALLAKKALRYRKVLEHEHAPNPDSGRPTSS
ncbi:hypothetical protein BBJ28_00006967 [Nothophytophthora sp. Chile5]|nr:hypothetical protein BBJ28_00006967 [Nothophytophthora sp. Chile5]